MKNLLSKKTKKKGFTLIELIIVLAVIAIIAAIAIPSLMGTKENAKIKADEKSCLTIERAITILVADETIPENSNGTITVVANGENPGVTLTDITDDADKKVEKAVQNALKGIKAPQEKDKDVYVIKLNDGKPAAKTAKATGTK